MRVIGKSTIRVDGRALVKGAPVFADDELPPGVLHVKILHSPHPHARVKAIHKEKALAIPGVVTILSAEDFPEHYYTTAGQGYPEPSPRDIRIFTPVARFVGDRIAAVAAETEAAAEEALAALEVEYEPLPAIFDPAEALHSEVILHPEPGKSGIYDARRNLAAHIEAEIGAVDEVLAACAHVFSGEYSTPYVQQASIEPHVTVTWLDSDGRLVIRTSTQVPFHVRRIVAEVLELPLSRIRVIKPRIGGGFGGKQEILNEEVCAAVTLRTGRPAYCRYTREEEFYAARARHPDRIKVRLGIDENLRFQALEMRILENCGAYGPHALTVMSVTAQKALSLYRVPNIRVVGDAVYTNLPIAGAYRGYGSPQGFFPLESIVDEAAAALGVDPIELRLKNIVRVGDDLPIARILGEGKEGYPAVVRSSGLEECLEEGRRLIEWDQQRRKRRTGRIRRGVGVAVAGQGSGIPGVDMASAFIKMNEDGSFNLLIGATDLGTGADTALAQIAAEVLEVPVEKILVYAADTDLTPFDTGAYASSTTYITGGAVKKAAEKVREQILQQGRKLLGAAEARLEGGYVTAPQGKLSYAEIATRSFYNQEQRQIMAGASHLSYDSPAPYNATFAQVAVNMETGLVRVEKIVSVTDAGQIINPPMAEGQVEGAIPQALGMVLSEFMVFDDSGQAVNTDFNSYHLYTTLDMPEIVVKFIHTDEPTGPFGAKAVAEIPIAAPAPAVTNAIYHACGVRIRDLPVRPEAIVKETGNR